MAQRTERQMLASWIKKNRIEANDNGEGRIDFFIGDTRITMRFNAEGNLYYAVEGTDNLCDGMPNYRTAIRRVNIIVKRAA